MPAMFGWLLVVNRAGRRAGVFPAELATFGERVGAAALVATGIAGAALLVPTGSVAQNALFGIAGVAGLPAYLAFPVWPILLARKVLADPGPGTPSTTTTTTYDPAPRHPAR